MKQVWQPVEAALIPAAQQVACLPLCCGLGHQFIDSTGCTSLRRISSLSQSLQGQQENKTDH